MLAPNCIDFFYISKFLLRPKSVLRYVSYCEANIATHTVSSGNCISAALKLVATCPAFWKMSFRKLWRYGFYSRLKHYIMVYCCRDTVLSGRCYSIFQLIICCKKRKEYHRLLDIIHAMAFDEISHRMLEERSINPKRTCNLYWNLGRYVRGMTDFYDSHQIYKLISKEAKVWRFCTR